MSRSSRHVPAHVNFAYSAVVIFTVAALEGFKRNVFIAVPLRGTFSSLLSSVVFTNKRYFDPLCLYCDSSEDTISASVLLSCYKFRGLKAIAPLVAGADNPSIRMVAFLTLLEIYFRTCFYRFARKND